MTREQAKQKLISFGVEEPTEEQISNLLDAVSGEVKAEKGRVDKLKNDLEQANSRVKELEGSVAQNLTDDEKRAKELQDALDKINELTTKNNRATVVGILASAGITNEAYGEDFESIVSGLVGDDEEVSKVRANAFVNTTKKIQETTKATVEKELLNNTKGVGGNGGEGGIDETPDVANAKKISFGSNSVDDKNKDYYVV